MKTLKLSSVVYLFVLFLATTNSFSQKLINANEVTPAFLKETFDNAYIEVLEVKDTYIKVKDVYTIYLDIDANKRYVTLSGVYNLVEGTTKRDALDLVNKLNAEVALIKVYYSESTNSITYYYYFWTEGGFTQKSLIGALRLYKTALNLSLDKDTAKLIK
ncbi:MAG: YbjN domain-containing protein [Flavobacterium sp.]|uniref:YbjN domain-containing protein n=1 Tax=Flavobacterium sp. TaxID=239 RepID=UPI0025C2A6CC|nr:YbjN domain-containing protein [Flavobacterium sp.]MCK6608480.1 YbjN domain-containing protein [Flavobacterium sp.]